MNEFMTERESELAAERDALMKDLRVMCRIGIDFAAVFGVVGADDKLKEMSDQDRVSTIFKTLSRLMTIDYPGTLLPGALGRKNMDALKGKFLFLQAIGGMVNKYEPCTKAELQEVIKSING